MRISQGIALMVAALLGSGCVGSSRETEDPAGWERVPIRDTVTIARPPGMTQASDSDTDGTIAVFTSETIELRVSLVRATAIDERLYARARTKVVDGRRARLVRFRHNLQRDQKPLGFVAVFHDIGDGRTGLLFMADCANAAAQDLVEEMVRSVRFLPLPPDAHQVR